MCDLEEHLQFWRFRNWHCTVSCPSLFSMPPDLSLSLCLGTQRYYFVSTSMNVPVVRVCGGEVMVW